jgi:hypothetical protein
MPLDAYSSYQAGSGKHRSCGQCSYGDPGQDVEGEVDAEVDAGEDDESPCQHEYWSKRRVEDREGQGTCRRRRGVAGRERAR